MHQSCLLPVRPIVMGITPLLLGIGNAQAFADSGSMADFDVSYVPETAGEMLSRGVVVGDIDGSGKPDVVIGSPSSDVTGTDAGRMYLFFDPGLEGHIGTSVQSSPLIISGEAETDQLGTRIGTAGDLNGDGIDDLAVAAPNWSAGRGRVYLFWGRTNWSGVSLGSADLVISGEQAGQQLGGGGVLMPGDISGDGYGDLLVSSPSYDYNTTNARDRGAVYVFMGNAFDWSTRTLGSADALYRGDGNGDLFGTTLVVLGDVNKDGLPDWGAGAPLNDESGTDAGQLYLFLGRTDYVFGENGAGSVATVRLRGEAAGDELGRSLVGAGDLNGDRIDDVIVGAPFNDNGGADSGRVYAVAGRRSQWPVAPAAIQDETEISFYGGTAGDQLGAQDSLMLSEASGDGIDELVMTSRVSDSAGQDAGSMYIFLGRSEGWGASNNAVAADALVTGAAVGDQAGVIDPSGAGDFDGNGKLELLVGAPGSDFAGTDGGEIYLATDLARWFDLDGDAYSPADGDCNDADPFTYPGAPDDTNDDTDNDCDGQIDEDYSGCSAPSVASRTSGPAGAGTLLGVGLACAFMFRRRRAR